MMNIEIPYYEDNTRISNSAIGWFLKKGPRYLRDMLDGKEEGMSAKFLEKGTMIHEYILQPEEFWKDYEILDFEVPKVKQQRDLCEYYSSHKLTDPQQMMINYYQKHIIILTIIQNLQKLGKTKLRRLQKLIVTTLTIFK